MISFTILVYRFWKWITGVSLTLLLVVIFFSSWGYFQQSAKQEKELTLLKQTTVATKKESERLKKELDAKIVQIEKNKIDLIATKKCLEEVMKTIEENGFFKAQLRALQESKNFINVGIAEINIKTNLIDIIANIQEFEDWFRKELEPVVGEKGHIDFDYTQPKETKIQLIIMKKGE